LALLRLRGGVLLSRVDAAMLDAPGVLSGPNGWERQCHQRIQLWNSPRVPGCGPHPGRCCG